MVPAREAVASNGGGNSASAYVIGWQLTDNNSTTKKRASPDHRRWKNESHLDRCVQLEGAVSLKQHAGPAHILCFSLKPARSSDVSATDGQLKRKALSTILHRRVVAAEFCAAI
jgi:hypothetical protein